MSAQTSYIDRRWGSRLPWFLRHASAPVLDDFDKFFVRIGQRMSRLVTYNEASINNLDHFGAALASDSLRHLRHDR